MERPIIHRFEVQNHIISYSVKSQGENYTVVNKPAYNEDPIVAVAA